MAGLLVLLIILGSVAYQYLRGKLIKSFATVIVTICASIVAFNYFELLAGVFVSRGGKSSFSYLVPWAQPLCFVLLFVLAFAIFQTIVTQLTRRTIDLQPLAERIGRVVCGVFLGLISSGLLVTVLAMAPLPNHYPYQRFSSRNPDAERPRGVLFRADDFATGWFSLVSRGSFRGKRSFAALHPAFLDQVFLNRHGVADKISIVTSSQAIEVPKKNAVRPAPDNLKDLDGKAVPQKSGHNLTIVRVGLKKSTLKEAGKFALSQVRLICKQTSDVKDPFAGKGQNIFPLGYLKTESQLEIKRLNQPIEIKGVDFEKKAKVKWLDFAFYVPRDFLPVLVEFKQNNIAKVPLPSSERAKDTGGS